ncbi:reverse transcriptase-like protein [Gracilibacillus sp. S3-1-1]|uniref:Reverse transcriptase-like protein n=1 Tax=Gracilibacillus pellucidus TaxID=3095368 RepID=A0ACC6M6Y8_9BACI|nr:reverse transcriptase-like protein [Gracilibacillus sp. S3-1-1]MDX8046738.1 reverse transcriptase-like protein [Gracilibacillus sp. S3-1-1]
MYVTLKIAYVSPKGMQTTFHSEELEVEVALAIANDFEQWNRTKSIEFIDYKGNHWNKKELKTYTEEMVSEPSHVTVYFDAGFDLKTNKAGLGFAIYYTQNHQSYRIRKNSTVPELTSNNEAEYVALFEAIKQLEELHVHHQQVTFKGDSKVVINQLLGEWPCMEETLNNWADRIERKLEMMGVDAQYQDIARKDNREAHQLATKAMENVEIDSCKKF